MWAVRLKAFDGAEECSAGQFSGAPGTKAEALSLTTSSGSP